MSEATDFEFDHERLSAYKLALTWLEIAERIARCLPRGRGPLADQLRRASTSIPLTIAEGVARRGADRARFYVIAKGSTAECSAILDVVSIGKLVKNDLVAQGRDVLRPLARMLIGLERQARSA